MHYIAILSGFWLKVHFFRNLRLCVHLLSQGEEEIISPIFHQSELLIMLENIRDPTTMKCRVSKTVFNPIERILRNDAF